MPIVFILILFGSGTLLFEFFPESNSLFNIKTLILIFLCISIFILFVLRICILPFLYEYIEKKSYNLRLKNFIYNLKHNYLYRLLMLTIVEIPFLILVLHANTVHFPPYKEYIELHVILTCTCDLLGCYIALFLWWDIQKLIRKYKK